MRSLSAWKHSMGHTATHSVKRQRWQLSVTTCGIHEAFGARYRVAGSGGSPAGAGGLEARASMRAAITKSDSCKPPIFRVVNDTSQKPHPNVSSGWCQVSSASALTALANANAV